MSGPKVITYTMNAFKGKLSDLLQKQTRLQQLAILLQKAAIHDETLDIHYDAKPEFEKLNQEIMNASVMLVFDYKGTFNQNTYNAIDNKINQKMAQVNAITQKCELLAQDYEEKKKDYKSYKEYLTFIDNVKQSSEKFKKDVSANTETYKKENAAIAEEAQKKYGTIILEIQPEKFDWGFTKKADNKKNNALNMAIDKETLVQEIRQELLDKLLTTTQPKKTAAKKNTANEEIMRICKKIEKLINQCEMQALTEGYQEQYNKLKTSESMQDAYFFKELHDHILESENCRTLKLEINDGIAALNLAELDASLQDDKKLLLQKALHLLNLPKIDKKDSSRVKSDIAALMRKSQKLKEDAIIRKKEQVFVKSQIIHNLESKGYEVMEDLQVIDFEKENDFYLKAPGQENLLNIKFKDDGSFRYVFQIPEQKDKLSVEEQKMKLHEMKNTCDDFVEVLNDLKQMGVDINVKSDKPIALESIITIPETVNEKLNITKKQTQRKQQIKKLYLD